jgi:putative SOS response-associated peptidase YedK
MCGRFANAETIPGLRRTFAAGGPDVDWQPSYNITPTRSVPVLLGGPQGRRLGLMRWGWHPPALGGRLLINCRGEEAHAKLLFADVLARRRCLVPATAFFEWRPAGQARERPRPYAFAPVAEAPFLIGGLWTAAHGAGSMILMTTPANQVVGAVHDRMPLIVAPEAADAWLDPATEASAIRHLIRPDADARWRSWPIGQAIGNVRWDDPSILDPLVPEPDAAPG